MKIIKMLCVPLTVLALSAAPSLADSKGHGKKPKQHHTSQSCPPGLAKKSPACVPPGQAKKQWHGDDRADDKTRYHTHYLVGERAGDDCLIVSHTRYKSLPSGTYCRYDDQVLRIDPDTRAILKILQILANN